MKKHLTEGILYEFLKKRFPDFEIIHNRKVPDSKYLFRPDYRIEELKLIVEFDGYRHYNNSKTQKNDSIKHQEYGELGYFIVRIPYFIQLNREDTIKNLFGKFIKNTSSFNNFSNGFISKIALRPTDFNISGMKKFIADMKTFSHIKDEIINSLIEEEKLLVEDFKIKYNLF